MRLRSFIIITQWILTAVSEIAESMQIHDSSILPDLVPPRRRWIKGIGKEKQQKKIDYYCSIIVSVRRHRGPVQHLGKMCAAGSKRPHTFPFPRNISKGLLRQAKVGSRRRHWFKKSDVVTHASAGHQQSASRGERHMMHHLTEDCEVKAGSIWLLKSWTLRFSAMLKTSFFLLFLLFMLKTWTVRTCERKMAMIKTVILSRTYVGNNYRNSMSAELL